MLLALAHVIAASKITTTVKDFTAGDFMCAFPFLCVRKMPVFCLGGCDVGHRNTFQPKRIAGEKKVRVRQTVRSSARGLEAEPVSCLYRQSDSAIVVMKSEVAGAWPEVGWNEAARQW